MATRPLASSTSAQKTWSLYNLLILVRVGVAPFLFGYVHPDEFFQGGQELWFGCPPTKPWEFEPQNALRSVVPPTIMTWLPIKFCAQLLGVPIEHLSGWYVWIIPRVACAIFSILAVDWSVWALARPPNQRISKNTSAQCVPLPVLIVASAWPTMVLLNRPFTNAMETWILAVLFRVTLHQGKGSGPTISFFQCCAVGFLSALGIFTRFTFVCFAVPIISFFGFKMIRQLGFWGCLIKSLATVFVFFVVAAGIMEQDNKFYSLTSSTVTPWNAFSYNSKVDNLQHHGLHPRWTHALVNIFILYGPIAIMGYLLLGKSIRWGIGALAQNTDNMDSHSTARTILTCSKWTIFVGLGLLSTAPHQEPRFLLPLLVPLALLCDNSWMREKYQHELTVIWIIFNSSLFIFFGVMHQSGVVPSLLVMGSQMISREPKAVIFYRTYMPPTFLSRRAIVSRNCLHTDSDSCLDRCCPEFPILDLDGSNDLASLHATIPQQLRCDEEVSYVTIVSAPLLETHDGNIWYLGADGCTIPGYACKSVWNHKSHISTEDFPSWTSLVQEGLLLSIYEVSCL